MTAGPYDEAQAQKLFQDLSRQFSERCNDDESAYVALRRGTSIIDCWMSGWDP